MTHKTTFTEKFRYWFDNYMSSGTLALIGGLGVVSLAVILMAAAVVSLGGVLLAPEGSEGMDFIEAAWESMMRTLDPGTMGGDIGWGFRWVMLFVTLGGIFIISTLIGVLTTGIEGKIEELRKGRSRILESNTVLADKDKLEMEEEIRERVENTKNTRVICRSGSPNDPTDLEIVSPHLARSIIILPPDEGDADAAVIKSTLALTNSPQRQSEPYNIVTQLRNEHSLDILRMVGKHDQLSAALRPRPRVNRGCRLFIPSCSISAATKSISTKNRPCLARPMGMRYWLTMTLA